MERGAGPAEETATLETLETLATLATPETLATLEATPVKQRGAAAGGESPVVTSSLLKVLYGAPDGEDEAGEEDLMRAADVAEFMARFADKFASPIGSPLVKRKFASPIGSPLVKRKFAVLDSPGLSPLFQRSPQQQPPPAPAAYAAYDAYPAIRTVDLRTAIPREVELAHDKVFVHDMSLVDAVMFTTAAYASMSPTYFAAATAAELLRQDQTMFDAAKAPRRTARVALEGGVCALTTRAPPSPCAPCALAGRLVLLTCRTDDSGVMLQPHTTGHSLARRPLALGVVLSEGLLANGRDADSRIVCAQDRLALQDDRNSAVCFVHVVTTLLDSSPHGLELPAWAPDLPFPTLDAAGADALLRALREDLDRPRLDDLDDNRRKDVVRTVVDSMAAAMAAGAARGATLRVPTAKGWLALLAHKPPAAGGGKKKKGKGRREAAAAEAAAAEVPPLAASSRALQTVCRRLKTAFQTTYCYDSINVFLAAHP